MSDKQFKSLLLLTVFVLFVCANGMSVCYLSHDTCSWERYVVANLIGISFLSRLFFYIESLSVIYALMAFEAVLSLCLGIYPFLFTSLAIVYSWCVAREFFYGGWLRTQLLLFSIIKAVAVSLFGYAVGVMITGKPLWNLPLIFLLSGVVNWNLFNLYEFSQHSFSSEEEKPQLQSYTAIYGIVQAVRLGLAQAFLATILVDLMLGQAMIVLFWGLAVLFYFGLSFIFKGTTTAAKAYRYASLSFIYYFFIVTIVLLTTKGP